MDWKGKKLGIGSRKGGAGQICCAIKRVMVAEKVFHPFMDLLLKAVSKIKMGDPLNEETDLGPLINEKAAEQVHQEVFQSIKMGAKCLTGGQRVGAQFYEPTLLVNVNDGMPCVCVEVFGPVVPISSFNELSAAIASVNSAPYGLQTSVFSEYIHNSLGVAHELEVGGVVVNGAGSSGERPLLAVLSRAALAAKVSPTRQVRCRMRPRWCSTSVRLLRQNSYRQSAARWRYCTNLGFRALIQYRTTPRFIKTRWI